MRRPPCVTVTTGLPDLCVSLLAIAAIIITGYVIRGAIDEPRLWKRILFRVHLG